MKRRDSGPGRCPFSQPGQTLVPGQANSPGHPHGGYTAHTHQVTAPHTARHTQHTFPLTWTWVTDIYTDSPPHGVRGACGHSHGWACSFTWTPPPGRQVCAHARTHTEAGRHTWTHTHRHTPTHTGKHTHTHIHTGRHTHTYMHTGTHTHRHTPSHGHRQTTLTPAQTLARRPVHTRRPTHTQARSHTRCRGTGGQLCGCSCDLQVPGASVWTAPHHFLLRGFQFQTELQTLSRDRLILSPALFSAPSPHLSSVSHHFFPRLAPPPRPAPPPPGPDRPSPRSGLKHPSRRSLSLSCLLPRPGFRHPPPHPRPQDGGVSCPPARVCAACSCPHPVPARCSVPGSILLSPSSPTSGPLEPQLVLVRRGRGKLFIGAM